MNDEGGAAHDKGGNTDKDRKWKAKKVTGKIKQMQTATGSKHEL